VPAAVWSSAEGSPLVGLFPHTSGSRFCVIHGGAPTHDFTVPATCTTRVQHPGGATTQVRFTQTSSAGDVHGQGSPAYQQFSQTYLFTVSSSGRVMSVTNAGHFPSYLVPAPTR
jgi:hypothetical protein